MRTMRSKFEEIGARTEHDIKTVHSRSDEIMQRAETFVASLRIEEVHRQFFILDATVTQTAATLGFRADESDQRITEIAHQLNSNTGP